MICCITFNYYFYFVFIMSVWQFVLVTASGSKSAVHNQLSVIQLQKRQKNKLSGDNRSQIYVTVCENFSG